VSKEQLELREKLVSKEQLVKKEILEAKEQQVCRVKLVLRD
jgi:hypothetical protein